MITIFDTHVSDLQQQTEWKVVDTANRRHKARPYTTAAIACGAFIERVSNSLAPIEAGRRTAHAYIRWQNFPPEPKISVTETNILPSRRLFAILCLECVFI